MRKYLIVVLCVLWLNGNAQTYKPFPTDSATWSVSNYGFYNLNFLCLSTVHYGIVGDTIINSMVYSKIYENNHWLNNGDTIFNPITASYIAALREDSSKKVYVIKAYDTADVVLYNFALNIGDTFCFNFFNPSNCGIVIQTDSVMLSDGSYRRTIILEDLNLIWQTWIEGIGNDRGLFEQNFTGGNANNLMCFRDKVGYKIGDGSFCHCGVLVDLFELTSKNKLKVYPNPMVTVAVMELPFGQQEVSLTLYDVMGRGQGVNYTISNNDVTIQRGNLPSGIYFFAVSNGTQTYTGKLAVE